MNLRIVKSLLVMLTFSLLALGCSKKEDDPTPSTTSYDFQAKVDGVLKQTNVIAITTANNVSITGSFGDVSLSISTDNPPSEGIFELKEFNFNNFYSGRYDDNTTSYTTKDGTGSGTGTLEITKVTLNSNDVVTELQGTFSFTASNGSKTVSITEGVIDYK